MAYESTYDFTDYYRCIDDCDDLIPDTNSEEKNMAYADRINNITSELSGGERGLNARIRIGWWGKVWR